MKMKPERDETTVIKYEGNIVDVYTECRKVARSLRKAGYTPYKVNPSGRWFKVPLEGSDEDE